MTTMTIMDTLATDNKNIKENPYLFATEAVLGLIQDSNMTREEIVCMLQKMVDQQKDEAVRSATNI